MRPIRIPTTVEELLAREEALALQGALDSGKRVGLDIVDAFDVPKLVRRHPLAAILASTLGGGLAGHSLAHPRRRSRSGARVASDASRNGAHREESMRRPPAAAREARLPHVSAGIAKAIKAAAIAIALKRWSSAGAPQRSPLGTVMDLFLR